MDIPHRHHRTSHRPRRPRAAAQQRAARGVTRPGDRIFLGLSRGSGILLLVIMAAIAVFLTYRAVDRHLARTTATSSPPSSGTPAGNPPVFGIAVLAFGTVVSSIIAMVIAVPVAVGIALFISHYAPRRLAAPLAYVIDLLAAVPQHRLRPVGRARSSCRTWTASTCWLDDYFGWTGIFDMTRAARARSLFTVGILLAIMILPIITNVSREVFLQVPQMHEEAALALGATRWEVIRMSVLPFGRSGVISASMLGLGRALGETMAVATVLSAELPSSAPACSTRAAAPSRRTSPAKFGEADEFGRDALIASGLVLFVITLLVNGAARLIIARRKEYSGANA